MSDQHTRQAQVIRTVSMLAGGTAVAASSVAGTGGWWLTVVFGAVVLGALWEIWKSASRASQVTAALYVANATTLLLAVLGMVACAKLLPPWLIWAGALSFAVAYIEYLVAYARRTSTTHGASASDGIDG